MIRCDHCGAETDNGLALCALCQRLAESICEYIPIYYRNLSRWRPGRAGSRPVPGSRALWDGSPADRSDRVTRALDEAGNALTTWARALADDRPHMVDMLTPERADEAGVAVDLCNVFAAHVTSIATTAWCGEWLRDLCVHEQRLRALTEQVTPGWYAGACKRCGVGTYVVDGFTWVTCSGCGATTYARDHLETVLTEARGWVARPKAMAEAIVALVDTEVSVPRMHDRIRQWSQREQVTAFRALDGEGDEVGPKRYRLGDVLDLMMAPVRVPTSERMRA